MLKRKISQDLINWKNNKNKKSLLLVGARQVGKTFIVQEFANNEYKENYVYINFEKEPETKSLFSDSLDPETFVNNIRYRPKYSKIDFSKKVLFVFDEIQACPQAITSLKFFTEAKYDVIGTGSLLGVGLNKVSSYPVGYVERLEMYPLDFEEFLWANGIEDTNRLKELINTNDKIPEVIHNDYMNLFKNYMIVGGMPDVVNAYINKQQYNEILKLQRNIVDSYKNDIAKYSDNNTKERAKACFESVPFQLARENKKFQYKLVENNARSREYEDSIRWLIDAGIIYKCNCLTNLELPLKAYMDSKIFKIYCLDTGLLVSMLDEGTAEMIISGELKIYKGAIQENVVATILHSLDLPLLYYKKDNKWEIDFVISMKGKVLPLEVKSSENTKSKSLNSLMEYKKINNAFKISSLNKLVYDKIKHLPLYLLPFIKEFNFNNK